MIADKIGWSGTVYWDTKPVRHGEIYLLNSSHQKLTNSTGWEPKVELSDGLDRTIEIWKEIIAKDLPFNNNTKFSRGK